MVNKFLILLFPYHRVLWVCALKIVLSISSNAKFLPEVLYFLTLITSYLLYCVTLRAEVLIKYLSFCHVFLDSQNGQLLNLGPIPSFSPQITGTTIHVLVSLFFNVHSRWLAPLLYVLLCFHSSKNCTSCIFTCMFFCLLHGWVTGHRQECPSLGSSILGGTH